MESVEIGATGVQDSRCGAPLCQLCHAEAWARSPEEWRRRAADTERTAAQYQKLFGDAPGSASQRKRDKKRKRQRGRDTGGGTEAAGAEEVPVPRKGRAGDVVEEVMQELGISPQPAAQPGTLAADNAAADRSAHKKRKKAQLPVEPAVTVDVDLVERQPESGADQKPVRKKKLVKERQKRESLQINLQELRQERDAPLEEARKKQQLADALPGKVPAKSKKKESKRKKEKVTKTEKGPAWKPAEQGKSSKGKLAKKTPRRKRV
jgi:hypothetical protein